MFATLREELGLPPADHTAAFDDDVEQEASQLASAGPGEDRTDRRDLALVTIDPLGAMDLDQAVHLERHGDGFAVHYAIADLGHIAIGGAVDTEARRRGQTIYLPDGRVPLHPPALSEDALSLLPDRTRGAVLWTIELDARGVVVDARVERALVRSVARLDYAGVQRDADAGSLHPSVEALPEIGRLRRARRVEAGALELGLPEQEVSRDERSGGWRLGWRERTPADDWNAELSLLTGMVAADLMLGAGVGLLRTLPAPEPAELEAFLGRARRLGVEVAGRTPAQVLDGLDPHEPAHLAVMIEATRLLRGAGFEAFVGDPPATTEHAGVGGSYAQVTAPLRRLADRFATEVCVAIAAGRDVPEDVLSALPELPERMATTGRVAAQADRAAVDLVEAAQLAGAVGQRFEALVLDVSDDEVELMVQDPPVLASVPRPDGSDAPQEGAVVTVQLGSIDTEDGVVRFTLV